VIQAFIGVYRRSPAHPDDVRPACTMTPLPPQTASLDIPLSWSDSDAVGEVDFSRVLVSVNNGPFAPLIGQTRDLSTAFRGENGKTYGFQCVATDTAGNAESQGAAAEATTRISIDTTPPRLTVTLSPTVLWPPNHQLVDVRANIQVTDDLDPNPKVVLVSITSNEPDNGLGDGDTAIRLTTSKGQHWERMTARFSNVPNVRPKVTGACTR